MRVDLPAAREIQLVSRPAGLPEQANFQLVETSLRELSDGEVLVRNDWVSVDPYMRGRMTDAPSYVPPFKLGRAIDGDAVGTVIASLDPQLPIDTKVLSMSGWRSHFISKGKYLTRPDPALPAHLHLTILGLTGFTAYVGLVPVAKVAPDEIVLVSAAAGGVGSAACQIARALGCVVIGTCGSDEKAEWLRREFGVRAAIVHSTGDLTNAISAACPEGVDVYFENVGGDHLKAALDVLNPGGRISVCGMISEYNDIQPRPGPSNLIQVAKKSLRMEGFLVSNFNHLRSEFEECMKGWIESGLVASYETITHGLATAPAALIGLFSGQNQGKALVDLREHD